MSVRTGQAKLNRAAKDLFARWDAAKSSWRDDVMVSFEKNHLVRLRLELRKAEGALSHMEAVVSQVRNDCG